MHPGTHFSLGQGQRYVNVIFSRLKGIPSKAFTTIANTTIQISDYDYTCVANRNSSAKDLCGAASWACYDQNYANMGDVCDQDWKKCCQEYACSHHQIVDQCTRIFSQYDSQVKSIFGSKL